jgi:hypothetical protein
LVSNWEAELSSKNTRLDISMAVHNALDTSDPKAIHEIAAKCIARYLLKMLSQGLILYRFVLNIFADADFAGH